MESSTASSRSSRTAGFDPRQAAERSAPSQASQRGAVLARMLVWGDFLSAAVATVIADLLVGPTSAHAIVFVAAVTLLWPLVAFSVGLYRGDQLSSWASAVPDVPRTFVALLIISWPLLGLGALLGARSPAFLTLVTIGGIAVLSAVSRSSVRARLHKSDELIQRALIIGSGFVAGQVVEKLENNRQFGLAPIGIIDDDVHLVGLPELPWLGRFSDLNKVLEEERPDRVIIAFSKASHQEFLECIRACRNAGVAIDVVPRLFEFLDGVRALDQVGGLPLLSIGRPGLSSVSMVAKRLLDVVGAATLLVVLSPLMAIIAVAIKLESRGPVFFRQPRAGRDGTSFELIKFRSMYLDAEERKAAMGSLNESTDGVMFKIKDDPRVTRVGRLLRRFSLDELPQLFNVLVGEMSLVGPRPLIFSESDALKTDWHLRRLELRPGLTGPWQVYGRSQNPFQEMVRFDYQYVAGWSLARDIELLLATIPAVLSGRGAY
jgi:exopolysaccharide biosynthesis polyprenyl glycosylphosphotransferase